MMTQEKLSLRIEGIDDFQSNLMNSSTDWLKEIRQRAVGQLGHLALPTVKDEEWKYTSLSDLSSQRFHLAAQQEFLHEKQLSEYLSPKDINIVLVNGHPLADFSLLNLPVGLSASRLSAIPKEDTETVKETMGKLTANDSKSLFYLNQALFNDGLFLKVAQDTVIEPLVHIVHLISPTSDFALSLPRSVIQVQPNAKISILETYLSYSPFMYWSNAVTDLKVGENAAVQYCYAEAGGSNGTHTCSTRIWQEKASHLELFSFAHQARLVRNNLSVLLKGESTNTIMNGFYALDAKQHVDNHTLLDIQQPNCTSYQLYKGILNDASHAVFNGKIYVHPQAQKTNGYQLNKHLLLGKEARIDTKPQLEIFADDVKCTHGATIGQLSEEEIFYLQSRCISKELAGQMLAKGFVDDILNTITSYSIREKLTRLLAKKFPEVKL